MPNVILEQVVNTPDNFVQLGSEVFTNISFPNIIEVQEFVNIYGPYQPGTILWYGPDLNSPNYVWTIDTSGEVIKLWNLPNNNRSHFLITNIDVNIESLPSEPSTNPDALINRDVLLEKYDNALLFWYYENGWSLKWHYETNPIISTPLALIQFDSSDITTYSFSVTQQYFDGSPFTTSDDGIVRVFNADTGELIYNSPIVQHGNLFSSTYASGMMGTDIDILYQDYLDDNTLTNVSFLVQYYAITAYKQSFLASTMFKV